MKQKNAWTTPHQPPGKPRGYMSRNPAMGSPRTYCQTPHKKTAHLTFGRIHRFISNSKNPRKFVYATGDKVDRIVLAINYCLLIESDDFKTLQHQDNFLLDIIVINSLLARVGGQVGNVSCQFVLCRCGVARPCDSTRESQGSKRSN